MLGLEATAMITLVINILIYLVSFVIACVLVYRGREGKRLKELEAAIEKEEVEW